VLSGKHHRLHSLKSFFLKFSCIRMILKLVVVASNVERGESWKPPPLGYRVGPFVVIQFTFKGSSWFWGNASLHDCPSSSPRLSPGNCSIFDCIGCPSFSPFQFPLVVISSTTWGY
jgi:hypothetical protein